MSFAFKEVVEAAQAGLKDAPENAIAEFSVSSRQVAGLESEVAVRQFKLAVDEPEALGGADAAPNPVEYVLAALASCQEITYRLYADALGIPLDGVSVDLKGPIDLRGFFAVDDTVRPGYQGIEGTVTLDSPAGQADLQRLKDAVDRHCPVLDILSNPTPVSLALAGAGSGEKTEAA